MGNECDHPLLKEPTLNIQIRQLTKVSNAPSNTYALRMKNQFYKLPQHIEQIRTRIKLPGVQEIIRDCPIYFIIEKQAIYQGQWGNGEPHGYGRVVYTDKSYYEGLFKEGQPCTFMKPDHHEDSIYVFPDGSYYRGEFNNSKFEGKGVLVSGDGKMKVSGQFKDGMPDGKAIQTLVYLNEQKQVVQSTYEGEFVKGIKQGKGKFQNEQFVFEGDFLNGKPHGQGQLIDYKNGIEFLGSFQNGKKMKGVLKSGYGIVRGNYTSEDRTGEGYYEWKDGKKFYIGSIKDDKLDGFGRVYHENGRVIEGMWKKGHNLYVSKIEQLTEDQVKEIKKNYEKEMEVVNYKTDLDNQSDQVNGQMNGQDSNSQQEEKQNDENMSKTRIKNEDKNKVQINNLRKTQSKTLEIN